MNDIYVRELKKELDFNYLPKLAVLHVKAFPDFFLSQLGIRFLNTLYKGYLEDENSGIIVAEDDKERLLGVLAYSKDYSNFYKGLLKSNLLQFAICSFGALIKHPSFIKRLLGAFRKSEDVKREEQYVELASIGVNPKVKTRGVGSALINSLKEKTDFKKFAYISLETDAENNENVNKFYQKNGFKLVRNYTTAEGRRMNEYRYTGE